MPDFTIRGNPGAIRSKAATTRSKGQLFFDTGDALSKVSVEGWTGRAADHFRDAHDLEPERWTKAGNGFLRAGAALETLRRCGRERAGGGPSGPPTSTPAVSRSPRTRGRRTTPTSTGPATRWPTPPRPDR